MPVTSYATIDGEILTESRGGTRKDYLPDPLGSTTALLDASQTKTDTWTYWPYGEERTRTGSTATPFQFVGTLGYYEDDSGRLYVRARHYRPGLARWQTVDELWASESAYLYAADSPATLVDRSGLQTKPRLPGVYPPSEECSMKNAGSTVTNGQSSTTNNEKVNVADIQVEVGVDGKLKSPDFLPGIEVGVSFKGRWTCKFITVTGEAVYRDASWRCKCIQTRCPEWAQCGWVKVGERICKGNYTKTELNCGIFKVQTSYTFTPYPDQPSGCKG